MKNFTISTFFNQLTAMPKRLAMVLTMLLVVGIGQAWGAEYTITFKSASSDSSSDLGATPNVSTVVSSGTSYVASFSGCSKMYVGKSGIKLGSSSATGTMNFTLATNYQSNIKSIKVVSAKYGSDTGTLTLYSGSTSLKSGITPGTDYTHTFNTPTKVTSIKLTTSAKRAYITKIVITTEEIASYTVNWTINPAAGGTLSATTGNSITVTPNAAYTYGNPAYTVSPAGKATVSQSTNTFTATPAANCTIQINMVQKTIANITFENMGSPAPTTTGYYVGDKYNLPSENNFTCGDKTFVGWSTVSIDNSAAKPTSNFYEPGASVTLGASNTFYAVFAEEGGAGTTSWEETGISGIGASDEVVITMKNGITIWALNRSNGSSKAPEATVVIQNYFDGVVADALLWNIHKEGNNLTIYPKGSTTTWLYCTNSNDGVRVGTNANKIFTIDATSGYLKNTATSRYVGVYTTNPDWRCYTSTTGNIANQTLAFYKKTTTGGYQNYTTECTTAQTYTVTIANNIENGTVTANPTTASEGDEITLTATPADGYKFSAWDVTRDDNSQAVSVTNNKFTMPASDVTVSATFVAIPKLATPTNLQVTNISCTGATLTWDNVANNNGYLLSVKNTSSGTSFNSNIAKDVTSGSPTLNPGTTYSWKVVAKGDATNYLDSEEADGGNFTTNYKITYDVKGGSWTACADGCVAGGEDFTICSTEPTKDGYNFKGWSTANDATVEYAPEETITVTENTTLYAVWEQKTYTVILSENGTKTTLTPQTSTSYTLPDDLTAGSCQDDTKEFVGWTTISDLNSATEPTTDYYAKGEIVTLSADKTTFYAVFATPGSGGGGAPEETTLTIPYETLTADLTNSYSTKNFTYGGFTFEINACVQSSYCQMRDNATLSYIYIPELPGAITKIATSDCKNASGNSYTGTLRLKTTKTRGNSATDDIEAITYSSVNSFSWSLSNETYKTGYLFTSAGLRIKDLSITYTTSGGTSYSDYTISCVALPDPVISFVTTPADPIVFDPVNCGGTTTKAQAKTVQVSGANLQDVVSVEVTGPYKIARTSSTNLSDYSTSLTLDKTNTGNINANYSTIYIISCPPAQSTDATTGTLTFTTKKGNTLTVNLSTPTVNCTTYALTFNDRGNKTIENYYAGVEVPQPDDPTGVCTDPIHYVFDGWAEATVTNGSTEYTKVTFPYTMPGQNKTLYAVYRYLSTGGNGDYNLVTSALDDWSGDYLIAYDNKTFADGRIGGKDGMGDLGVKVDLSSYISNNTIPATEGDKYNVTLEAVTGGYLLKTKDGKYNYQSSNASGLSATDNQNTASNYKLSVNFVSSEEINLCLSGNAQGAVFRYNTSGYFRFYKDGGQAPVYLYKKSSGTTLYTTSPICGAYVEITSDKDIYVTGGNAGGTRSIVVAQKTITFSATRLQPNASGNAPSIKVPAADITIDGNPTTKVALSITQDLTEQGDGTYAGTGEITISYTPTAFNVNEDINVQLRAEYNTGSDVILDAFTVHARSLPQEFVIVAKSGDKWYALNGDMSNGSSANPANGQVVLDDDTEPTKATYAPCNTIYTFDGLPNTGDRKYVRFQGTDGAWLWAASGTSVGIQNKTLAQTPTGDNKPYNWKLETEDNITYKFHNDNNSRLLGLSGEKFGMYASGVQEFRILPYDAKCLYNYAPTNLKVSVLKGSYVTLTWDAVAGATKYQYSTDATTWTDGTAEPTVTINGLSNGTNYTYYIRAYHADAGVSQECFDYSEITFTTADCDDVPTDITYTADLNSITVSWTAAAPTATIKLYSDEAGEHAFFTQSGATSPWKISSLQKNTTYYLQIFAGGTCASQIIPVKTEDVEVDIVEWDPQGIIVDINTDETIGVTLENEVSYGSGTGADATELFFSKYYEATTNVKLVAIYNGTKNLIDLTDYQIHYGKDSWESQYITLKDFGATKGQIQPGEEIILYTMSDKDESDRQIMACVNGDYPNGKWVRVTQSNNDGKGHLSFAGDKTIVLKKAGTIIDIIGALDSSGKPTTANAKTKPSWGDANGWNCATGLSIEDDTQIGISTNRCLLIRNNTVTSGENAVTSNIDNFNTLCSEWKGAQVPDSDEDNGVAASCENFAYVGTFDYSDYYTQYEPMGEGSKFDENARNADGTVTIPITDLYKQSCRNIRVKLSNANGDVLTDREYKVPIMITTTQGTDGEAFLALQENLATIETDAKGNEIARHPLSLEDVREICKTCDVVIRNNATLTKVTDGTTNDHPQVRDVKIYEGASLIVDGTNHNYTINSLSLRRKGDLVASANVKNAGQLILPNEAAAPINLDLRVDANNWHWFTLPYDCNIADVTWVDGSPAQYNVDWFLMTYDGESRSKEQSHYENHWKQYFGTTIEAGKGYIVGITGDLDNSNYTFELRFPMATEVLTKENGDKTVPVNAWGVKDDITPNKKGWNLVGNPYLDYYQPSTSGFKGLPLIKYTNMDPVTGEWHYDDSGDVPFIVTPVDGGWYEYKQELASEVEMMPFTAYFVQVGDPEIHENGAALNAEFIPAKRGRASLIQRAANEVDEVEEPAIVRVTLTNAKGESDKTSLIIDDQYTDEYEMNADFFKWFGDYYKYYTKPVLYTMGADEGKRAFNALSEELASQPVSLGMYAAKAGNYTFSLDRRNDLVKVEEVWLYDATQNTYTNLLQDSYTFYTAKTESAGRFFLSVKMAPKVSTDINNITNGSVWATTQDHTIFVNGLLSNAQLWIYDAAGKLLHTDQTQYYQHSYSVPVSGTYFVRVQNTMQTQTIKVVVE